MVWCGTVAVALNPLRLLSRHLAFKVVACIRGDSRAEPMHAQAGLAQVRTVPTTVPPRFNQSFRIRVLFHHHHLPPRSESSTRGISTMAGERSSSEADRKLESGNAKNATESANNNSSSGGLHPAFYIAYADHHRAPFLTAYQGAPC
jgi:hypothetical protein